jgi:recombination protein U
MYYIPFKEIERFYERSINGGRKSFRFEELENYIKIETNVGVPIHYIEALSKDLKNRG